MASNAVSVDQWWATHREYYFDAFAEEYRRVWEGIPSVANDDAELSSLSYYRALTCFLKADEAAVIDRRRLLYAYLLSEFENRTAESTINRYRKQLPVKSTVRRVVKNVCTAYDEEPRRRFQDGSDTVELTMESIYNEMRVASQFQRIYHRARLCGMAIARPLFINGRWHVDYMTPDQFRIETDPDDIRTMVSLTYPRDNGKGGVEYVKWTSDTLMTIDVNGRVTYSVDNPYQRIPYVACRLADSDTAYTSGMYELVEAQLDVNKLKFLSNLNAVFAGSPQWVAINFNSPMMSIGADKIIKVDGVKAGEAFDVEPTLDAVTPDSSYQTLDDYAREQERAMQHAEGIPVSMTSNEGGVPPSGVARLIERNEIIELRYSDQKALREFEKEFAVVTAIVASTDIGAAVDAGSIDVQVSFAEESIVIEPDKEYAFDKEKVKDGVMSVEAFYQKWAGLELEEDELADEIFKRKALADVTGMTPSPLAI